MMIKKRTITKSAAIAALAPNAEWVIRGDTIEWLSDDITQPTEAAIDAKVTELVEAEPLRVLRILRDDKLLKSDWTQGADSPLTDAKKAEWATYRQELRDITDDVSDIGFDDNPFEAVLTGVTWPTEPS